MQVCIKSAYKYFMMHFKYTYILKLQSSALISCVHVDDEIYMRVLH